MCGICGAMGGDFHWSASLAKADANPSEFRRQRRYRIELINELLTPLGVTVSDFHNKSILVSSPTGATEIVEDLAQLWVAVDRICPSAQPDPLDTDGILYK
jgi:hypothetical protein